MDLIIKREYTITFLLIIVIGLFSFEHVYGQLEKVNDQMVVTIPGSVITGKHFSIQGEQALVILADDVTVQDCLFSECDWAIVIRNANGVTIKGNRFENVGTAIRSKDNCNNIIIEYNEARGVGLRDNLKSSDYGIGSHGYWANNFVMLTETNTASISYNIVDNQGLDTKYLEDCINVYGNSPNVKIKGNRIRGTSNPCSISASGGAIVIDCSASNYLMEDNICIRMQAYGVATAGGSNTIIQNNYVYLPLDHVDGLNKHPSIPFRGGGSFSYGNTGYQGCGSNNKLINNYGYSISANALATGCAAKVNENIWNVYDECGFTENLGNDFPTQDPEWDSLLPDNMFVNLGAEYFSSSLKIKNIKTSK